MTYLCRLGWLLASLVASATTAWAQTEPGRFALLVGINRYQAPVRDLAGAENDVDAVREVLLSRWGWRADRIRMLKGIDASRLGVLNAVTGILSESSPGDEVFVFFAGHGTSAADPALGTGLPYTSGALVPADFAMDAAQIADGLIIGRRDLRPLLEALDRGGRRVFVAVDACYSGNTVRGRFLDSLGLPALPARSADVVAARFAGERATRAGDVGYPYQSVVYLSAAAEHEVAGDIPQDYLKFYPTRDNRPHGAFTDALLRALHGELPGADSNDDGRFDYVELHAAVGKFMAERGYPQTPQLLPAIPSEGAWVAMAPVFGQVAAPRSKPAQAAAAADGEVRLRVVGFEADERGRILATAGVIDSGSRVDFVLLRKDGVVRLLSPAGDLVATGESVDGADLVQLALRRARFDALVTRASGDAPVWLDASGGRRGNTVVEGDEVVLSARLSTSGHLVMLNLDPTGAINLLYPLFDAERRALPANRTLRLDGTTVVGPFGHDTVYAFVVDDDSRLPDASGDSPASATQWIESIERAGLRAASSLVLVTASRR